MPLTHVCVWKPDIGYQPVTIAEACQLYPWGASASSECFTCSLCGQSVCLTQPGDKRQHFRHDSNSENKVCEDRQQYYEHTYGGSTELQRSHTLPLRIIVDKDRFSFHIGFSRPTDTNVRCDNITIHAGPEQKFVYSFERMESHGITYLYVGNIPAQTYRLQFANASPRLDSYWNPSIPGVSKIGSFFDAVTGHILQPGSKAYWGKDYYLLLHETLYNVPLGIHATKIADCHKSLMRTWYLYQIHVEKFTELTAKFFLKYFVFLTAHPTKFYPIWPDYVTDSRYIYHHTPEFYFYLCGDDVELKAYPSPTNITTTKDGRLYKLLTSAREQLVSLGHSGAQGFAYLMRQEFHHLKDAPTITVCDMTGNEWTDAYYDKLPKSGILQISATYDGKITVTTNGRIQYIYRLSANQRTEINQITYGTEVQITLGCDCLHTVRFEKKHIVDHAPFDKEFVYQLEKCQGASVSIPHSMGSILQYFDTCPLTKQWLLTHLKAGVISRQAYRLLINHVHTMEKE